MKFIVISFTSQFEDKGYRYDIIKDAPSGLNQFLANEIPLN